MARGRNGVVAPRDRSEEVYAAALRLFTEKGYHATSMQDIADAVGLYKGSLYHYISGKEELLERVFEGAMDALLCDAERVIADASLSPRLQLRKLLEVHVMAVASNLDALTVYLHEYRALSAGSFDKVREQRERYRELVETVIAHGVEMGEFGVVDVSITTLGVLGMCNWLAQWYRQDGRLSAEQIAEQFGDLVINGLVFRAEGEISDCLTEGADEG